MFPSSLQNGLLDIVPTTQQLAVDTTDLQNPNNGQIERARYINPTTGDYEVDTNGHFYGMDFIQQEVMLALLTTFGSASSNIGNNLSQIKLITPTVQTQVQSAVQSALANLLNNNQISLAAPVKIFKQPNGRLSVFVNWINLTTNTTHQSNVPLGRG
jgi:hypothetical protein